MATITITFPTSTFLLLLFLFSSTISGATTTAAQHRPFKSIFAFGDSFTDTGNTKSDTGPSGFMFVSNLPYGRTFFHRPTNRYSDGRLVIDFVAESLSLPFLPPYLDQRADKSSGVNFAVAGSTAIVHSFFAKNNMSLNITPQSLSTQLSWFDEFLEKSRGCKDVTSTGKECDEVFKDSLVWFGEIGANDYAYSFGSSVPEETVQKLAINSVTVFLEAILKKGAKYVVVQGLPPTGCLTLSMYLSPPDDRDQMGCFAKGNNQTLTHNLILQSRISALRKRFPESTIIYADYYGAYKTVIMNKEKYGFKELFEACCGYGGKPYNFDYFNACGSAKSSSCANPSQYVNWDGVHLTEAMYKVVADEFVNGTYCKPSFSYLLSKRSSSMDSHPEN